MSAKQRPRRAQRAAALALGLVLVRCAPDFDSLSNGAGGANAAGMATGGSSNTGGVLEGAGAPVTDGGTAGSSVSVGGTSSAGSGGSVSSAGDASGGAAGAGAAGESSMPDGGQAGAGPAPCVFKPNSTVYDAFDGGLSGPGFTLASTTVSGNTTLGATAASNWAPDIGKTCPGSLQLDAHFPGYASGTANDEEVDFDLRFNPANWTGVTALHAWVKVNPTKAPITGVRFFVLSGASYLYSSAFDDHVFANGGWNEMILPLAPSAYYDPTNVFRLGIQVILQRAGTAGLPAAPVKVDVWLDDVWLQK